MNVSAGTRLGPYEVVALLGAGGMGDVYRACDTKLDRDVAVKVLPASFAADRDRVARLGAKRRRWPRVMKARGSFADVTPRAWGPAQGGRSCQT